MNLLPLIEAKRDGHELSPETIHSFVDAYTAGALPDYQTAAFLMAVFFRGLSNAETRALTLAMRDSGKVLAFPPDPRPVVDKHSTGGIGDKVSLPLAPLLACLGFRVPMISGRGLGITGGTLDKLESIPGFSTALDPERLIEQVQSIGIAMAAQGPRMIPADRGLYALRDATGTVPSLPLITASILSKKLAEGLQALILDVKFGRAAFMQTREQARDLARALVEMAVSCGVNSRALITDMNAPLGSACGNWLEVREAVDCLEGRGPHDLLGLVLECAASLLVQTGLEAHPDSARQRAAACLASGHPRRKWDELLAAQGADLDAFRTKLALDHTAPHVIELQADRPGFLQDIDARVIGEVIRDLGGGRLTRESSIDPEVGLDRLARRGEPLEKGSVLCRIHAAGADHARRAAERLQAAFRCGPERPMPTPLIAETFPAGPWNSALEGRR